MESDESQSGRILVYLIWFYFYLIILIGLECFFFCPLAFELLDLDLVVVWPAVEISIPAVYGCVASDLSNIIIIKIILIIIIIFKKPITEQTRSYL